MDELYEEFGHLGVSCYYLLMEICAEKLEKTAEQTLTLADCSFSFSTRFVRKNLRISAMNVKRFLSKGETLGLFTYNLTDKELKIDMPILLELLDSDSKRSRSRREQDAARPRLDKDTDLDKEKDTDKESSAAKVLKEIETQHNRQIWEAFSTAYELRWKVKPLRNAAVNAQISNLRKKVGITDAVALVKFYLTHNDQWYLKNTHAFQFCLKDAETLRTQMLRGQTITGTQARNGEKQINLMQNAAEAKKGGF